VNERDRIKTRPKLANADTLLVGWADNKAYNVTYRRVKTRGAPLTPAAAAAAAATTESICNQSEHLESFVEPDDIGMSEDGHDARLAVQIGSLVFVLHLACVDDLYGDLQRHTPTTLDLTVCLHRSSPPTPTKPIF